MMKMATRVGNLRDHLNTLYESIKHPYNIWRSKITGKSYVHISAIYEKLSICVSEYNLMIASQGEMERQHLKMIVYLMQYKMTEKDITTCFRLLSKSTLDEKTLMIYHKQRALEAYKWIINDTKNLLIPPSLPLSSPSSTS